MVRPHMDSSTATLVASFLVALLGALSAYASQRAASKATTMTSRNDMEKDAYSRARTFDVETIARQDKELDDLRVENKELRDKLAKVEAENGDLSRKLRALADRVNRLEPK
jgi:septal ring factor EnvC (AmiA/AmiB activator)